jgi:hypothetical protein
MDDKLVTIAQYNDYIQADMARQMLEDCGIKAVVVGQNASNVFAGVNPAIKGPQIQVLQSQAQQAKEILEQSEVQEQ